MSEDSSEFNMQMLQKINEQMKITLAEQLRPLQESQARLEEANAHLVSQFLSLDERFTRFTNEQKAKEAEVKDQITMLETDQWVRRHAGVARPFQEQRAPDQSGMIQPPDQWGPRRRWSS